VSSLPFFPPTCIGISSALSISFLPPTPTPCGALASASGSGS